MKDIFKMGFVVSQMAPSQLCYQIIESSNRYLSEYDDVDICTFWVLDGPRPVTPKFSCMPLIEAFAFNGHTIGTNLHTVSRILTYPGPNRKKWIYFYDYNLDYMRIPPQNRSWDAFKAVYNHPKVQLIARSQEHAEILTATFKKPLAVIEDFDIAKLKEVLCI